MTRCYIAHGMTGRTAKEVMAEEMAASQALRTKGIFPLGPATEEKVDANSRQKIASGEDKLRFYWQRDKELIRSAHVVLDMTGPLKSAGVEQEIGYARWFLYKPVVRLWPSLGPSIARIEGDAVVGSLEEAADVISARWGTAYKRLKWRLSVYNRCWLNSMWQGIREWLNIF